MKLSDCNGNSGIIIIHEDGLYDYYNTCKLNVSSVNEIVFSDYARRDHHNIPFSVSPNYGLNLSFRERNYVKDNGLSSFSYRPNQVSFVLNKKEGNSFATGFY